MVFIDFGDPGSQAASRVGPRRRQPGQRGYLGKDDPGRALRLAVAAWARCEEGNGHALGRLDLFRQFRVMTEHHKAELEQLQEERPLTSKEASVLKWASERLEAWQKAKQREKAALKLLSQTGFRERLSNRQTPLSERMETQLVHDAWRWFDYLVWLVAKGTGEDLVDFVADPALFRERRKQTVICMTDQIPVWLKVDRGKRIVSFDRLEACREGTKARRNMRAAAKANQGRN